MRAVLIFAVALMTCSSQARTVFDPQSTVTIPLREYLELTKQDTAESIATIESVVARGEYGKHMELTWSGLIVGKMKAIGVMRDAPVVSIRDCSGNGVVRVENSEYQLLPQSPRFKVTCRVDVEQWNELAMTLLNSVRADLNIKGAEAVTDSGSPDERRIRFVRSAPRTPAQVAPLITEPSFSSRYHIMVLQEETKFNYYIAANNPNAFPKSVLIKKQNGEVVQKIVFNGPYTDTEPGIELKLPPGESHITISGKLSQTEFKPPLTEGTAYLLLESHPKMRVHITGEAKKISPRETGIGPSFVGAQAFFFEKSERLKWTAKKQEVYSGHTYTVTSARYHYFWSQESDSIVEASFTIDNQGMPEIILPVAGRPLYVEVNGQPQFLNKGDENELSLYVPYGKGQMVMVQYQTPSRVTRGIASVSQELSRPSSLMSNVTYGISIPKELEPLYAAGSNEMRHFVSWPATLFAMVFLLMLIKFSEPMGLATVKRVAFVLTPSILIAFKPGFFWVGFFALAGLLIFRHRERLATYRPTGAWGYAKFFAVLIVGVWLFAAYLGSNSQRFEILSLNRERLSNLAQESAYSPSAPPPQARSLEAQTQSRRGNVLTAAKLKSGATADLAANEAVIAGAEAASDSIEAEVDEADKYEGLPAKVQIPQSSQQHWFSAEMMDEKSKIKIRVLAVSKKIISLLTGLLSLVFLLTLWTSRRSLAAYLNVR
ncbi:MAG: hypothetical protein AB7G93_04485 [Bdellovibrionales bacterium]